MKALISILGAAAGTVTLNQWVLLATLIYTLLQTYFLMRKHWFNNPKRDRRRGRKSPDDTLS